MSERGYLFDTNVWMALVFASHPLHAASNRALLATGPDRKAWFCRATQQSFLRLISSANIAAHYGVAPLSNRDAFGLLDAIMDRANVGFMDEPTGLTQHWKRYGALDTASPKRWMDAYLAAFSVQAGLELVSADSAFRSFPELSLIFLAGPQH